MLVVACIIIGTDLCFSLWRHEECCRHGIEELFLIDFIERFFTLQISTRFNHNKCQSKKCTRITDSQCVLMRRVNVSHKKRKKTHPKMKADEICPSI